MRQPTAVAIVFSVLGLGIGVGTAVAADGAGKVVNITIGPQALSSALQAFSEQTGLQVGFASEVARNIQTRGTQGAKTAEEALRELLDGTDLRYAFANEQTVVIKEKNVNSIGKLDGEGHLAGKSQRCAGLSSAQLDSATTLSQTGSDGTSDCVGGYSQGNRVLASAEGDPVQNSGGESNLDNDLTSAGKLEEVIVTAQKRKESAQSVPMKVDVLSADDLQQQGLQTLGDYAKEIPGLNISFSGGAGSGMPAFRGMNTGGEGWAPLAAVYMDDIPLTQRAPSESNAGTFFDPDLGDLDHLEVLEGPQATLYGAMTMTGLIKYVTKQPDPSAFSAKVTTELSDNDHSSLGYLGRATLNIPLVSDKVAIRLNGTYRGDPGFVDNVYYGLKGVNFQHVKSGRLSMLYQISDNLTTTVTAAIQDAYANGPNSFFINPETLRPIPGALGYSSAIAPQTHDAIARIVSDTTVWDMHFATLTNILSIAHQTVNNISDISGYTSYVGNPPDVGAMSFFDKTYTQRTDELRLASAPGRFEWLLGMFYTRENDLVTTQWQGTDQFGKTLPSSSPFYNIFTGPILNWITEWAEFGDLTYHLSDQWDGTIGIRHSQNSQSYLSPISSGLFGGPASSYAASDSSLTYLGTVSYHPLSNLTTYVRAASSYQPGSGQWASLPSVLQQYHLPLTYQPDYMWNYEVGAKGSLWDQKITYTADAFRMVWTDLQVVACRPLYCLIENVGSAKSDGIETSWKFNLTKGLSVGLNGAYINARITSDVPDLNAVSGQPMPGSPKFNGSGRIDYRVPLVNDYSFFAGATYAYHGVSNSAFQGSVFNNGNAPVFRLPAYSTLDLRLGIDWSHYSAYLRVNNLTNEYGVAAIGPGNEAGFPLSGTLITPRTFSVGFSADF